MLLSSTPRTLLRFMRGDEERGLMDDARDSDSEESDTAEPTSLDQEYQEYMLGTVQDKAAITHKVKELTEDDLEDSVIVAAVHMQIHWQSAFMRTLKVWCTFGLYLVFSPRESQGVLLLTKKGRVLNIGTSYTPDYENVVGFSYRLLFHVLLAVLALHFVFNVLSDNHHMSVKILVGVCGAVIILVLALTLWGSRPRRDCGSDFRQQFHISDLCVGTYSRVDSWCCCYRRRRGHLRLCFGKTYPDQVTIEEGHPLGVPTYAGSLKPSGVLSPAAAGVTLDCYKEQEMQRAKARREAEGRHYDGFTPFTAIALAILGTIAGVYEYSTLFDGMKINRENVCMQKVKGCSWEVPNPEHLGQMRTVDSANPPKDSASAGCDEEGEFCSVYWREMDYCSPDQDRPTIEVRLQCHDIHTIRDQLEVVQHDNGRVSYHIWRTTNITTMAVRGMPSGGQVPLEKGTSLEKIGKASSNASQKLLRGEVLDWNAVEVECVNDPHFEQVMLFLLREETEVVDLQDSDCVQLQNACMAQFFGEESNGWWPMSHLFDWTKTRTVCAFMPDITQLAMKKWFWHAVESHEPGLTCVGLPTNSTRLKESENETACQQKCLERDGCNFAFFKPLEERFTAEMWQHAKDVWEGMPPDDDNCLLYDECPGWTEEIRDKLQTPYEQVECGDCVSLHGKGKSMPHSAVEMRLRNLVGSLDVCRENCSAVQKRMCNAFSVRETGEPNQTMCTLYGHPGMRRELPVSEGWEALAIQEKGIIGEAGQQGECFMKLPQLPSNPDRMRTGTTGQLFKKSDHRYCIGCAKHELTAYLFEWQNFATVVAQLISIFGVSIMISMGRKTASWLNNEFTGKPIVDLEIVGDAKNTESFEEREDAYRTFLTACYKQKEQVDNVGTLSDEKFHKDCWDWEEDDTLLREREQDQLEVVRVEDQTFEDYILSDLRMEQCFVDKRLLGCFPDEKVLGAWPERTHKGFWRLPLLILAYFLFVELVENCLPAQWQYGATLHTKRAVYVFIPCVIWLVFYVEYRRGINSLCVITNAGRVLQITRSPPVAFASRVYANLAVRIDVYHIGTVILAQVDMRVVAHCLDVLRECPVRAGRRGKVTIKAGHGFLELERRRGAVMVIFRAMSALVDTKVVEGLPDTPFEEMELYDVSPQRDIKTSEEKHVWTRKFQCAGYYNDPFNYTALLTITDHRTIIVRARMPKPLSFRAILCGPRTCGGCCIWLQDLMQHTPYLTVATLGHNHLQSYASIRKRAPPFWPGLMTPVAGCTVSLLPLYMSVYPSGFAVTQRPYGVPRNVTTRETVTLKPSGDKLHVTSSKDRSLPYGRMVDSINGELSKDLVAQGYTEVTVEPGSDVILEAASDEWSSMADEAWLYQLRKIYDYIIKRTEAEAEKIRLEQDEYHDLKELSWAEMAWASVVGADMLGHHQGPLDVKRPLGDVKVRAQRAADQMQNASRQLEQQVAEARHRAAQASQHLAESASQLSLSASGSVTKLRPFWLQQGNGSDSDSEEEGHSGRR